MARTKLDATTSHAPDTAVLSYTNEPRKRLNEQDWTALGNDLYLSILASLGERGALEQNLKDWLDLYEMRVDTLNWPWENASNVFIPIIPAQLNTSLAYIVSKVFVPRFYLVTGNTEQSAPTAYKIERYYNTELHRQRGDTTWFNEYINWLHEAERDGTAIMEVLWRKTVSKKKVVSFTPEFTPDGIPVLNPKTGEQQHTRDIKEVEVTDYDDVELKPVLLRDFLLVPSEAFSPNEAVAVARAIWPYECDLNKMVKQGTLDKDEVERALSWVPIGENETAEDMQGYYDKTAGDQIIPGLAQGTLTSKFFANRGPIKVWRIHSRQFDMNGDGIPEENIFWVHEKSQRLLGWVEYDYIAEGRPFFPLAPDPRPDRFYGYSLCERLAPIQAEVNAMYNQRNNLISLMLSPPLLYRSGDELDDNEEQWGPGVKWASSDPQSVQFVQFPNVPVASFQNEALLNSYVEKLEGTAAPAMGGQSSGRRTKAEIQQQFAATISRNDLTASRLRIQCKAIINFIHHLKLQYLEDDPQVVDGDQKFTVKREELGQDFTIDIAGASDPMDSNQRREQVMGLFPLMMQVPFIVQDQVKSYRWVRKVMETFNFADVNALIGTEQEAMQRQQQMQQQQQQEKKKQDTMELISALSGKHKPPGQPGQQQQGQAKGVPKPHGQ